MEIWKSVPGYEGQYEVSSHGQVRSLHKGSRGKILSVYTHNGYPTVILSKRGCWKHQRVQRLMALAFLPNPEKKPWVYVIDGNENNLSLENLKWVTRREAHELKQSYRLWKEVLKSINTINNPYISLKNLVAEYSISNRA